MGVTPYHPDREHLRQQHAQRTNQEDEVARVLQSITALRRLGSRRGGSKGYHDGLPRIQRGLRESRAQAVGTTYVQENDCQSTLGRNSAAGESAAVGAERQSGRASLGDAAGS